MASKPKLYMVGLITNDLERSHDFYRRLGLELDYLSAHKAPEIKTWLAHPKSARWHLHFTPTSSSWLNLVEGWFKLLTERRLRHGVFSSVEALREAIELWAEHWNDDPKPFVWRKTAEEIIEKVRRGRAALHHVHATPHH